MKKFLALVSAFILIFSFSSCGAKHSGEEKLSIVTTIFPAYDFARAVAGDKAEITMLIKPGSESHTYEPTPKEAAKIYDADLFLYNGGEGEKWAENLISSLSTKNVLTMMECTETLTEEIKEGMEIDHGGEAELDEHVWLSLSGAQKIIEKIAERISEIDPENADYYENNAKNYISKINELKEEAKEAVSLGKRKTVIFADRFPARYFANEFSLDYYAAFPGCSEESEASAKTMAFLCDKVEELEIPAVFYIEFSNQKTADAVCEATGAKKLLFHSCHNVSAVDMEAGITYIDLMRSNIQNIKEALA